MHLYIVFVLFVVFLVFVAGFVAYKVLFALVKIAYEIILSIYFKSEKFHAIKNGINQHTKNCNDLNGHIEKLKSFYSDIRTFDYGESHLYDNSLYNMNRREWDREAKNNRTHNCSASVCKNASNQPFKYLCKYFDIKNNEETLSAFEEVLNNFAAAEQGKILLKNKRDAIISSIKQLHPCNNNAL